MLQRRKIPVCTLLSYVSRYKRRNTAARWSDTNQRSVRAPFHCVKPFITT